MCTQLLDVYLMVRGVDIVGAWGQPPYFDGYSGLIFLDLEACHACLSMLLFKMPISDLYVWWKHGATVPSPPPTSHPAYHCS